MRYPPEGVTVLVGSVALLIAIIGGNFWYGAREARREYRRERIAEQRTQPLTYRDAK